MTRLTARRRLSATRSTCTGKAWACPEPGCNAAGDTAWTRVGARVQQWRHRNTHR